MSTATTGTRKRAAAFFFGAGSALNLANAAGSVNSATLDTPQGHTIRCLGAHRNGVARRERSATTGGR